MERNTATTALLPSAQTGVIEEGRSIKVEYFKTIHQILYKLQKDARAKSVLLVDRSGQLITSVGRTEYLDITSFASLSAADFAATKELATLIGEKEFSDFYRKGKQENIYFSLVDSRVILVVLFDKRSILGLVRVRVIQAVKEISRFFKKPIKEWRKSLPPPYWTTIAACKADWKRNDFYWEEPRV